jgi:uncharacterized protein YegP (UPF0339 family)
MYEIFRDKETNKYHWRFRNSNGVVTYGSMVSYANYQEACSGLPKHAASGKNTKLLAHAA